MNSEDMSFSSPHTVAEHVPALPPHWDALLRLAHEVRNKAKLFSDDSLWPIKGLARRSGNLVRGVGILVMHGLWVEALICGRALMEIEITMKWLLHKDRNERISYYATTIDAEKHRLARKMSAGVSVSAQVMNDLIGPELRDELRHKSNRNPWPKIPIREMAKEVDMDRNYDVAYWLTSIFAHAHPLSIVEAHPPDQDHLLCPLFTCEADSGLPRGYALTAIPMASLHLFSTASEALALGLNDDISHVWQLLHDFGVNEDEGIPWVPRDNVPLGDVIVYCADGTSRHYSPQRSDVAKGER
jgi:hypothetical protein